MFILRMYDENDLDLQVWMHLLEESQRLTASLFRSASFENQVRPVRPSSPHDLNCWPDLTMEKCLFLGIR
jgi:hypothetical protein